MTFSKIGICDQLKCLIHYFPNSKYIQLKSKKDYCSQRWAGSFNFAWNWHVFFSLVSGTYLQVEKHMEVLEALLRNMENIQ